MMLINSQGLRAVATYIELDPYKGQYTIEILRADGSRLDQERFSSPRGCVDCPNTCAFILKEISDLEGALLGLP